MDGAKLFSVGVQQQNKVHKLEHRKSCNNARRNFFTVRVTEHWNRLLRGVVESPSLEILKTHLNAYSCNLL